ncbi:site-2 protease family protein [Thermococcus gorgonarius]|uniref:Metalloprotease n=1 Tax=Thermococcus gorgonarius TaxID=71997 RepID=A0A2Z2MEP2_THEGO|nr:site-2 protease family protein [Thermococcus gorgonarius]ASJ00921.1 metalloprotease [Thermococcus gorgonarius]
MTKGVYECVNCGHREVLDSTEPLLEKACPKCGGDMVLVGFSVEVGETITSRPTLPAEVEEKIREFYSVEPLEVREGVFTFEVREIINDDFERFLGEIEDYGYWAALKKSNGRVVLYLFPAGEIKRDNPWIGVLLFIATLLSTLWAGYVLALNYIGTLDEFGLPGYRNPYVISLAFSMSVLGILGTHELGHKIAASLHNVKATFPYFIPFPNLLGTLGAVIRVKSPIPTRKAAIDLGVSGPLAGILVAIPVTAIGLRLSTFVPVSAFQSLPGEGIYFGTNLLFEILQRAILNPPSGDYVLLLHPVAIAGWVGVLVTFLNLIPAAQLDGGHVARAFMSERLHRQFTWGMGLFLVVMSYFWVGWFLWALLILFIGSAGNPGALDEVSPIPTSRKLLALLAAILFVLTATPVPFYTG